MAINHQIHVERNHAPRPGKFHYEAFSQLAFLNSSVNPRPRTVTSGGSLLDFACCFSFNIRRNPCSKRSSAISMVVFTICHPYSHGWPTYQNCICERELKEHERCR